MIERKTAMKEIRKREPELWRRAKALAALRGITLQDWLLEAILEKIEKEEEKRQRG